MKDDATAAHDGETLLTTAPSRDGSATAEPYPVLTVLAHPDASRVGERLFLPALAAGLDVRLSRTEPVFNAPGRPREDARPLDERHLSRQPLRLSGRKDGAVVLDAGGTRTTVAADGEEVDERTFSVDDLERGVVLTLARRVVLLLHRCLETPSSEASFGLVGESAAVERLRAEIARLAPLDVPVLLRGETGTGKELTARALHDAGAHRDGPYVTVNMATLPPTLAAAELFGAERGAYTGADRKKGGLFQQARGGTLFLDEIGETPSEVQPMLLRALETGEVRPVGATESTAVDVRVIAATDADLDSAVADGRFRGPLYHRLAGYALRLPPLRDRRDDVGRLFMHFLERESVHFDEPTLTESGSMRPFPPAEVMLRLAHYDWPGNVRELRNVVRRLLITGVDAPAEELLAQLDDLLAPPSAPVLPAVSSATTAAKPAGRRLLRKISDVSEEELLAALEANAYKLQPTAEALGLSRINLYRRIDASPNVRKATDLEREEIEAALQRHGGDREAAAAELRVSLQGLKRQMTALGEKV